MTHIVIHRDSGEGRWFTYRGKRYDVAYSGPGWGWAIHAHPSGSLLVDGYHTLRDLRDSATKDIDALAVDPYTAN